MQEELIEKLISVEEEARRMKAEGEKEIKDIRVKYKERITREERVKLKQAREKGKKLLDKETAEAEKYAERVERGMEKELTESEERYNEVKSKLLDKYFNKIIEVKGV